MVAEESSNVDVQAGRYVDEQRKCDEKIQDTEDVDAVKGSDGLGHDVCVISGISVSKVENPCGNIEWDANTVFGPSVTLISVDQVKELQKANTEEKDQTKAQENNPGLKTKFKNLSSSSDSDDELVSYVVRIGKATGKTKWKEKVKECRIPESSGPADEGAHSLELDKTVVNTNGAKETQLGKERLKVERKTASVEPVNKNECKIEDNTKALQRFRFKRKLPRLTDSDLEEVTPEKKVARIDTDKERFVTSEKFKVTGRKVVVSNTFFSGDGGKVQPKLSFFVNKNKENMPQLPETFRDAVKDKDDKENSSKGSTSETNDVECDFIEELVSVPIVKDERDLVLREEIKEMR